MSRQPVSGPSRRKWNFTFTLRTMLVVVTALCIWLAIHTQRARRQQQIAQRIREKSCSCTSGYDNRGNLFRSPSESWAPSWLLDWLGEDFFYSVTSAVIFDDLVADAAMLPHLQELAIVENDGLTDGELSALRGHRGLKVLHIFGVGDKTQITDRSLALMGELPGLEYVRIMNTGPFSAKGLRDLAQAPRLVRVEILCCDESVTPTVAELFRQHSTVRSLYLRRRTASGEEEVVADWTR